jgi:hypothetical protein
MNTKHPPQPITCGEYNHDGYEIWRNGQAVYSTGNHAQDSSQPATTARDRLPLNALRKLCIRTAREIAEECGGTFGGVERVTEK